jgi:hypothetical protein
MCHFSFTTGTAGSLAISAGRGRPMEIEELTPTKISMGKTTANVVTLSVNDVTTQPGQVALSMDIKNEFSSCIVQIPGAPDQKIPSHSTYRLVYVNGGKGSVVEDENFLSLQEFKYDVNVEVLSEATV